MDKWRINRTGSSQAIKNLAQDFIKGVADSIMASTGTFNIHKIMLILIKTIFFTVALAFLVCIVSLARDARVNESRGKKELDFRRKVLNPILACSEEGITTHSLMGNAYIRDTLIRERHVEIYLGEKEFFIYDPATDNTYFSSAPGVERLSMWESEARKNPLVSREKKYLFNPVSQTTNGS